MKIPFRVSARTARLIGRENIATAKGAIIELVKNAYDADSRFCIIYFDNLFNKINDTLSIDAYRFLVHKGVDQNLLDDVYELIDDEYCVKKIVNEISLLTLKTQTQKLSALYIIDGGEGMTEDVIRNNWMIIGTDNKAFNYFTRTGRIKAGAKGIGRFALDKLGSKCEMTTIYNPVYHNRLESTLYHGFRWIVNWEDFEGDFKTIENVSADLIPIEGHSLNKYLSQFLPKSILNNSINLEEAVHGTILKITELRDDWDEYYVNQVFADLEVLVPPKESAEFDIFVFSSADLSKYGEVSGSICDDYDYKVVAKADNNQNVNITIYRNEYDIDLIPSEFFQRPNMRQKQYEKKVFRDGFWSTNKTFNQLIKGFEAEDKDKIFEDIGLFEFTFYFMKRSYTSDDAEKFFYKKFMSNNRKDWLSKFGGVKLFRDSFRVRPYGEANDVAFDWLGLGSRKAISPAGIAKPEGGYRVEPENIAGAISISRLTNVRFEDKSSREGLQENKTFQVFKNLIISIISIFESDRAYIAREMAAFYSEINSTRISREEAERLAKKILEDSRDQKKHHAMQSSNTVINPELVENQTIILAELNEKKDEQIEKLKDEQKLLRGLASSGIVLASFSHDLSKLEENMTNRVDKVNNIIGSIISEDSFNNVEDRKNPFYLLEKIKRNDLKLRNWLNFSLGATRKDKRKRKQLFFASYFINFSQEWGLVLEERNIKLDISDIQSSIAIRAFEIDFDCIFNNLLVNSIEAFTISKFDRARNIKVQVYFNGKEVVLDYLDSGPGLSSDIDNPNDIFIPLYTTKRDRYTGEEIGTGLGMWLIKSIIEENDGKLTLLYPAEGFGIRMSFPCKFKK